MTHDTLSLDGKVAIVTGSGRENGIGAAIANALARNGAAVTINYVSDSSAPRAAAVAKRSRMLKAELPSSKQALTAQKMDSVLSPRR
jgi:NAD(P)-dependent dehydrogenase (short-subunit alcohol dehydrogenase family)